MINRNSFLPSDDKLYNGTVEVTLRGETRRVRAYLNEKVGTLAAYEMFGTYQTSGKRWPACIIQMHNGVESVNFGRDDRSGRFNKRDNIWFN